MTRGPDEGIRATTLGSGLRVVTEAMPAVRSVAVGFWVDVGSRDEPEHLGGATHFLEHLLFKGTARRSAREIADAIEWAGGEMNAFTGRESTLYYVRVADAGLELALDVLSDIVWSPALRPEEVEAERQVILEEIRVRDDTPDDVVHDVFCEALLPGRLGRDVVGTSQAVEAVSRDQLAEHHDTHYRPDRVVVAVAGNVSHEEVVAGVERHFAGGPAAGRPRREPPGTEPRRRDVRHRDTEQAHLIVGMPALPRDDPDRYALSILDQAFGGGMSSRLFQEVREERGLAYAVYSFRQAFADSGLFAAYAGTAPQQAAGVLDLIEAELDRLVVDRALDEDELERARSAIVGHLALSLDSPGARMHRIGHSELTLGETPSVDELIDRVRAVTPDDVARVIDRVVTGSPRVLAAVGPLEGSLDR